MLHQIQYNFFKPSTKENTSSVSSNFLKLSPEEENFLTVFFKAIKEGVEEDVLYQLLQDKNPAILAKLSKANENFQRYCCHPKMDSFWIEAWRTSGNNPTPKHPDPTTQYHDMLPQPGLSCFQLYRGTLFYNHGMTQINGLKEKLTYDHIRPLLVAIKDSSFHALYGVTLYFIERINETIRNNQTSQITFDIIKSMMNMAKKTSELHGTPGFLLSVKTHMCIARYYHCINQTDLAKEHYKHAFFCLCVAKELEQICQASINNAYYGKGISASSSLGFQDCSTMKNALQQVLVDKNQLTMIDLNEAEEKAKTESQRFTSPNSTEMKIPDGFISWIKDFTPTLRTGR